MSSRPRGKNPFGSGSVKNTICAHLSDQDMNIKTVQTHCNTSAVVHPYKNLPNREYLSTVQKLSLGSTRELSRTSFHMSVPRYVAKREGSERIERGQMGLIRLLPKIYHFKVVKNYIFHIKVAPSISFRFSFLIFFSSLMHGL